METFLPLVIGTFLPLVIGTFLPLFIDIFWPLFIGIFYPLFIETFLPLWYLDFLPLFIGTFFCRLYFSGVNMSIANYDGRTALHLAASEGHSSCVKFLVEVCHLSPLARDRYIKIHNFWKKKIKNSILGGDFVLWLKQNDSNMISSSDIWQNMSKTIILRPWQNCSKGKTKNEKKNPPLLF